MATPGEIALASNCFACLPSLPALLYAFNQIRINGGGAAMTVAEIAEASSCYACIPNPGAALLYLMNTILTNGASTEPEPEPSSLLEGLVSYWKLDEESGARNDSVGANHLTDFGAGFDPGKIGNAATFVGVGEYLTRASNASLSPVDSDMTFSCWVNLSSKAARGMILAKCSAAGVPDYYLEYESGADRFRWTVDRTQAVLILANTFGSPSIAVWYFIVVWYDATANTLNIQVNNGAVDSVGLASGSLSSVSGFSMGRLGDYTDLYLAGALDEVGYWSRVLTAPERTALYAAGAGLTHPFT